MKIKFKKGSKIHIKDSQKGSFTKYCNGKVTEECIQKGKNSPDPKIRKKATFAANARKWNHKDGGEIQKHHGFVNGVNVLDSNPNIYKKIKQREKIKKAQEGTKFSTWLNNNKDTISNVLGTAMGALGNIKQAHEQNKLLEAQKKSLEAKIKTDEAATRKNLYSKALNDGTDKSDVVNRFNANTIANSADLSSISQQYQPYLTQMDYAQAQNTSDAWTGTLGSLFDMGKSLFNKKSNATNNITPSTNTTTSNSPFKVDISKTLVNQANNISFKPGSLSWYKQQGI